jgi:hypothetical protein
LIHYEGSGKLLIVAGLSLIAFPAGSQELVGREARLAVVGSQDQGIEAHLL